MTEIEVMPDNELIRAEFMRRFSTWNIPIEQLDITLQTLTNEERQMHYLDLKDILSKPAFHREIADWKRRVSRTLSMGIANGKELTELEKQGLRQLLIEIEVMVEMWTKRSMLGLPTKPLNKLSKKV